MNILTIASWPPKKLIHSFLKTLREFLQSQFTKKNNNNIFLKIHHELTFFNRNMQGKKNSLRGFLSFQFANLKIMIISTIIFYFRKIILKIPTITISRKKREIH
jgi:hypothetical protein